MRFDVVDKQGRTLAVLSPGRVVVALAEVLSVAVMVAAVVAAAPARPVWPAALVVAVAAVAMTAPDSAAGLYALLGYGAWWFFSAGWSAWVVVGALAGLVFHVALAHAAAAPAGAVTEARAARSLVGATALVAVATIVVALLEVLLRSSGQRTPAVVIGLALAAVALLPWLGSGASE